MRSFANSEAGGITYLARDHSLHREVVIKENLPVFAFRDPATSTVHPKSRIGEDADLFEWSMESFIREAQTLAKFDHPNIVRILRVFEGNNTAYFVMPYVKGETFGEVIARRMKQRRPFSEVELGSFLFPLLSALEKLHSENVYHRDIKPGNLLITEDGFPVLIDFGAARQLVSEKSQTVIESPGYTPFEQLQTRGKVGPWSDLYALAGTFYKAITYESPPKANDRVGGHDPIIVLANHGGALSQNFCRVLDQALSFNPEERPQSAPEMGALLREPEKAPELPEEVTLTPRPQEDSKGLEDRTQNFSKLIESLLLFGVMIALGVWGFAFNKASLIRLSLD